MFELPFDAKITIQTCLHFGIAATVCKGKFFSENNMKLVGWPCFANILLLLNIFEYIVERLAKYGDLTSNKISSEKT